MVFRPRLKVRSPIAGVHVADADKESGAGESE
jgi:hypothetical protein